MKTITIPATLKVTEIKIDLSQDHLQRVEGRVEIHPLGQAVRKPQTTIVNIALPPKIVIELEEYIQDEVGNIMTEKDNKLRIR